MNCDLRDAKIQVETRLSTTSTRPPDAPPAAAGRTHATSQWKGFKKERGRRPLAQSRAAGRGGFACTWMHNAMVKLDGADLSKSVGVHLPVSEVVKRVRPIEPRYYLVASHYRSIIEFSFDSLAAEAGGRLPADLPPAVGLLPGPLPTTTVSHMRGLHPAEQRGAAFQGHNPRTIRLTSDGAGTLRCVHCMEFKTATARYHYDSKERPRDT